MLENDGIVELLESILAAIPNQEKKEMLANYAFSDNIIAKFSKRFTRRLGISPITSRRQRCEMSSALREKPLVRFLRDSRAKFYAIVVPEPTELS